MGIVELFLIAVGLSMDAFAVSVCKGLGMKRINFKVAVVLALFFGGFQALMPVIGWALGSQFLWLISPIDHWIAFILLAIIGGKMLWVAFHDDEDDSDDSSDANVIDLGEYLMLAIATSIDALAMGISFAALSVNIVHRRHHVCSDARGRCRGALLRCALREARDHRRRRRFDSYRPQGAARAPGDSRPLTCGDRAQGMSPRSIR